MHQLLDVHLFLEIFLGCRVPLEKEGGFSMYEIARCIVVVSSSSLSFPKQPRVVVDQDSEGKLCLQVLNGVSLRCIDGACPKPERSVIDGRNMGTKNCCLILYCTTPKKKKKHLWG